MSSPSIRRCIKKGQYKTLHLADEALISRLKPGTILINACRGPVVDNAAIAKAAGSWSAAELSVVLDVWERSRISTLSFSSEWISAPRISPATPSKESARDDAGFEAYSAFIGHPQQVALDTLLPAPEFGRITLHGPLDQPTLKRLVHLVYDVRRDDAPLRKVAGVAGEFDKLRKNYLERREWSLCMCSAMSSAATLLRQLGFNAVHHPAR